MMPAFYWKPAAPRDEKPAKLPPNVPCFRLAGNASARLPAAPAGNQSCNSAWPAAPGAHQSVVNFWKFLQWGRGAVGSAPRWHRGGRGFESHRLHQNLLNFAWLQRRCFRLPSRQFRCLLHLPGGHAPRSSLPPAPAPVAQAGGLGWRAEKKGGVFPLRKRGPKPHSESPHDLQAHCFKPLRIIFPCDPSHILSPCGNLILV